MFKRYSLQVVGARDAEILRIEKERFWTKRGVKKVAKRILAKHDEGWTKVCIFKSGREYATVF